MFAEELAGNASRKRAEENRARRRRLKQEQQKKEAKAMAAQSSHVGAQSVGTGTSLVGTASPASNPSAATTSSMGVTAPQQVAPSTQISAVERAKQQRDIRAISAQQGKAALVLLASYRCFRSNWRLREEQQQLLSQRLQDLSMLSTFLRQKAASPGDYVPPPATTTALTRQLLYVTSDIRYRRKAKAQKVRTSMSGSAELLQKLLEFCVVPSLRCSDDNMNAPLVWMQSPEGRLRLNSLLHLSVATLVSGDASNLDVFVQFLKLVAGGEAGASVSPPSTRQAFYRHCRALLIPTNVDRYLEAPSPTAEMKTQKDPPYSLHGASIDLIAILRYYLMFMIKGGRPIPNDASELREACVSSRDRTKASALFMLIWDATQSAHSDSERHLLHVRILTDIFTIPLLSWKLGAETISVLVTKSDPVPPFLRLLGSLVELHSETLAEGRINSLLLAADASLTLCPATPSQCLLANLVLLGQRCPAVNGAQFADLDSEFATLYFDVLSTIVDVLPVGTFTSRDSSVEWMSDGKGHHTPIVLSPIILDQCKLLLLDSFVRRLFHCAIDTEALGTDDALGRKDDKDLKQEKELYDIGSSSAAALAAKEARVDRSKSFWKSSKWAKKLTKGVTSLLSTDEGKKPGSGSSLTSNGGQGALMNTSSMSRKLAAGGNEDSIVPPNGATVSSREISRDKYTPDLFFALCRTYSIVLARWGGGGAGDIVQQTVGRRAKDVGSVATARAEGCVLSLLNVLCFSTSIVRSTWGVIQSHRLVASAVHDVIDADKGAAPVRTRLIRPLYGTGSKTTLLNAKDEGVMLLFMFVATLSHMLVVTDDIEIHDMERPLPVHQIRRCIQVLKKLLYRACCVDYTTANQPSSKDDSNYFGLALISASSRTMRDLYDRSSRRPLCVPKLWLVPDLLEKDIRRCKTYGDFTSLLGLPVLRVCPFLVSFKRRLKIFERIVTTNRIDIQGVNDANPFNANPLRPGIPVRIMRGRLLEDGLATMNHLGSNMRERIVVQYVNEAGARETGVDAGGLFKEFWTDLSAIAFDPNYALFRVTDSTAGNCLYPNPSSSAAHGSDHVILFEFLGRILGKALYEGITIHPRFAHFFLSFLRGDYNYLHMLPDLSTIDPQLYNNLMFLKTYDGDASDLCLTFTVTHDEFGGTKEINLIPNGSNVDVTNANKQRYIGLVAKHYVVDRVKEQSEAFTRGLWDVIDRNWLRIFNEPELQVLISGASDGKIDIDDMRANTHYVGGYSGLDRHVNRFWKVVASMNEQEQAELLRFVTSCERPPPLGFGSMNPPFTIQRVGILRDGDKLPTSSTCFNTLKLPTYSSEKVLKQRLLYAIQSGAGFELT